MGTQKNRLSETIILSSHTIGSEDQIRILEQNAPYLELCYISFFDNVFKSRMLQMYPK